MITELNERSQAVLRFVVDSYMENGEPTGSRTLSQMPGLNLSPASIRNVMADMEAEGLLYAPHVSAGRLPTQKGMRLYIDGLMEVGNITEEERRIIDSQCHVAGHSMEQISDRASTMLSGLSEAAGLVIAPKTNKPLRHVHFVQLDHNRVLVVLVMQDNMVENRVMEVSGDLSDSVLESAANYLNARLAGKTLLEARESINKEIADNQAQLDSITTDLVKRGLALSPPDGTGGHIIIRGQSKLLDDIKAVEDLENARRLLSTLEDQETMSRLLESTQNAEGIQIYIGTENQTFEHSGWSMIISPYKTAENRIIGAIGVIGPTRLNYGRIIPVVDYTAKVMSRLTGS